MPNKPTKPYAYINFRKDGTVEKVVETLPADKEAQEQRAAEHLVNRLFPYVNAKDALKRLPERDNDFRLLLPDRRPITLELVELASREYVHRIDVEEWHSNSRKYPRTMLHNEVVNGKLETSIFNIDLHKKAVALTEKVQGKLRYAKPTDSDFWLLIWTCETEFVFAGSGPNGAFEDEGVQAARRFMATHARPLYDEIWVTNLLATPHQIFGSSSPRAPKTAEAKA